MNKHRLKIIIKIGEADTQKPARAQSPLGLHYVSQKLGPIFTGVAVAASLASLRPTQRFVRAALSGGDEE